MIRRRLIVLLAGICNCIAIHATTPPSIAQPDADHSFSEEKHRAVLLHEIEPFLAHQLLE